MAQRKKKNEIDMLHGPLLGKILAVALPLAAISILQQLFNAADVAVVGRFASDNSLAAVGANTPIVTMFLTFFTGLATGGNVVISNFIGRGRNDMVKKSVHTIFTLSLICGAAVLMIGEIAAAPLIHMVNTPEEVLDQATLYLRIYLIAMMFAVIYNFCSAILRSKGDTRRPLYALIASGILNICLNLLFVIVCKWDVAGVAIATLISNVFCAGAVVFMLIREEELFRIDFRHFGIDRESIISTLKIGLPTGIQGLLFSVSNIIIQSGINSFGTACIAGNTAAFNFESFTFFVVSAFGQTASTFVSQNYGAEDYKRCKKSFWLCFVLGISITLTLSCCFYFGHSFWLGLFSTSEDVLQFAMVRMTYLVLVECLTGTYEIPASAMRGMGVSLLPAIIIFFGSCVLRIIWVNTVFQAYRSYEVLLSVYPLSWTFLGIVMIPLYFIIRYRRTVQRHD